MRKEGPAPHRKGAGPARPGALPRTSSRNGSSASVRETGKPDVEVGGWPMPPVACRTVWRPARGRPPCCPRPPASWGRAPHTARSATSSGTPGLRTGPAGRACRRPPAADACAVSRLPGRPYAQAQSTRPRARTRLQCSPRRCRSWRRWRRLPHLYAVIAHRPHMALMASDSKDTVQPMPSLSLSSLRFVASSSIAATLPRGYHLPSGPVLPGDSAST